MCPVAKLIRALSYRPEICIRFPMVSFEIFIDIVLPTALEKRVSAQLLTEISARNISWV
jgi:hypothetical protein